MAVSSPVLDAVASIASEIDPNIHSCGSVGATGARELTHPEPGLFIVGAKSYGRAPTFLLATGYEQVRSIVAALVGDHAAARRVELDLPQTGVCTDARPRKASKPVSGAGCCGPATAPAVVTVEAAVVEKGCCGGPASAEAEACCVDDAAAKAAGQGGCGCPSV